MSSELVPHALIAPERLPTWVLPEWELLIRQARRAQVLARIAALLDERELLGAVPAQPRSHLLAAQRIAARQRAEVHWEVDRIRRALAELDLPVILLKGAAYVVSGLPPARGRLLSDIDILVPRDRLAAVENTLFRHGWTSTKYDAYDQRYYREWMHELPPLHHITRRTVLDVHHTIVPLTARLRVDARKLLAATEAVADSPGIRVLSPTDMVLHSATHLFQEGEFENGLRDLADIDDLLRYFGQRAAFWSALERRAAELNLGRPLFFAVAHTRRVFATPMPAGFRSAVEEFRPRHGGRVLMSALLRTALRPDHPSCDGPLTGVARWLLYVRGHYLRMPPHLLLPHLARKGLRRRLPA